MFERRVSGTASDCNRQTGGRLLLTSMLLLCVLAGNTTQSFAQGTKTERAPATLLVHGDQLLAVRDRVRQADALFTPAMSALRADAARALTGGPWSVTVKTLMPPSGDARDYQSFGPYWWPDSTKNDGLPYIRRDGVFNPVMRRESDAPRLYEMTEAVETLALAYWFTGEERYAARASMVLRRFFLDSLTGMRPHLRYGQAIPGVTKGRGIGLIDTRDLVLLFDAIALIRGSRAWTDADHAGMQRWSKAFLAWMLTSPEGLDEKGERNNHGMWYDAQVVALALFVGDSAQARVVLREWTPPRLTQQLAPDGSQPEELSRTRPLHYSAFNLDAMTRLAEFGRHVGIDLWTWRGANGADLTKATEFLAPYLDPARVFPKAEVTPVEPVDLVRVVRRVARARSDSSLFAALQAAPADLRERDRSRLFALYNASLDHASLDSVIAHALRFAASQLARTADTRDPKDGWPRITGADGAWEVRPATQWTSGFFPGSLWYMYALTRDSTFRDRAMRWTTGLEPMSRVTTTHDLGFVLFDSFGNGYRATQNPAYRDVLLRGASSLATRYNPKVGAIKSWDTQNVTDRRNVWAYPVIVDNLMNLELLYWAASHGGSPSLATMATRHALTSLRGHVRADGSTAHVVLFDTTSGARIARVTWQGDADTSAWARGQAWAIHGLTAAYRESHRAELLAGARTVANWWIAHLPPDGVPYWDFRARDIPNTERDASAAAIAASGLYELSGFVAAAERRRYRQTADAMLRALCQHYLAEGTPNESILLHSVGGRPLGVEIDVGISYADYYFLEAIQRRRGLQSRRS